MNYKELYSILPVDIIKYIGDYDNTSKERMNNVIKQINEYNEKVKEYWAHDEMLYYLSDYQILYRQKLGLSTTNLEWPLPGRLRFLYDR